MEGGIEGRAGDAADFNGSQGAILAARNEGQAGDMAVGEGKKRLLSKAGVDGPLSFIDQIEFLQCGRGIARFPLGRCAEYGNLGRFRNLDLPPRFGTDSGTALPRVGAEDLVITVAKVA